MAKEKLKVLIVESPGLPDITTGFRSGEHVRDQLSLMRVPCTYRAIHTMELLPDRLSLANDHNVVHLSGHGNTKGLSFTDGTMIEWEKLLGDLVVVARDKLVVLSACSSYPASRAMSSLAEYLEHLGVESMQKYMLTFWGSVSFADDALAWGIFYRHLREGSPPFDVREVHEALTAVKGARLKVKICASAYTGGGVHDISPWFSGDAGNENSV